MLAEHGEQRETSTTRKAPSPDLAAALGTVALNYRYFGCWNEVNARIAQRQNAVTVYVSLSIAILTILASAPLKAHAPANAELGNEFPLNPNILSLLMPLISLLFGFLNFKHDRTIAVLRAFMSDCEKLGSSQGLPGYNSDNYYRQQADKYRNFHDYAAVMLIVMFNIICLAVGVNSFPGFLDLAKWPIIAYFGIFGASLVFVTRSMWSPIDFSKRTNGEPRNHQL